MDAPTATATTLPPRAAQPTTTYRINSIDFLRGLVMVIMALDHARDFFYIDGFTGNPTDLSNTTPALFLTRWITHFCAPVFVFLAGTSIFLQGERKSKKELSAFLLKRGLWLVFVEIIIMSLILSFDPGYSFLFLQVIWATGISMIVMAMMIWLPFPVILAVGLLIVFGHNALDAREAQAGFDPPVWYQLLHRPAFPAFTWNGHNVVVLYPFLPWIGVMLLGYCLGKLFRPSVTPVQRRKALTGIGLGVIALFILLRAFNTYGDPLPWSEQKDALFSFFSFVNTQKYPPSLLFTCMTIGPALLFLAWLGEARNWFSRVITVYGRVPFFYYILHFFLIHLLSAIFFLTRGHSFAEGAAGLPGFPFRFAVPGEGYSLGVTYLLWLGVVIALYPLCKWFSEYKRRNKKWWVSYL